MRIGEALPQIFKRTYPVIQPSTEMFLAASLLRFHKIDALPIEFKASRKKRLAVLGYSCLSKLLETRPQDYGDFLRLPAEKAALELSIIDVDEEVSELLKVFQRTKFGFAWVESAKLGGFASLQDLVALYENDTIDTKLKLADLASPIFSLPGKTNIQTVISEMFERRIRRIFVDKRGSLVTDRRIIGYLFSPSHLEDTSKRPQTLLDVKLEDLETMTPVKVRGSTSAKKGARLMSEQDEECLICEKGVITPWDMIMKPLAQGALQIRQQVASD